MRLTIVFALLAVACTRHRDIREAHELESGDEVVAENHRGQTQPARIVKGFAGDVQLHSPIGVLPRHQVAKITETSHGRGALQGLGLGALIGGGLGVVSGFASGDDQCSGSQDECPLFELSAPEKAVVLGVVLGAAGGLIGLVIGATIGSKTIYEEGDTRITPIGPQGSTAGITVTF